MTKPFTWSHSALSNFELCPKQYYHLKVLKDVKSDYGEAAVKGQKDHKALEDRLKNGQHLPTHLEFCEPICQTILDSGGELVVEGRIGLTEDLNSTKFFAKDVWARGVLDVGIFNNTNAVIFDWKTGKHKPDNDQMRMFAAFTFADRPYINRISTAFVWLKDKIVDKETFTREEDEPVIWQEILHRVSRVESAYEKNRWPAQPSGLCRKHCPVKSCEHNGEYSG